MKGVIEQNGARDEGISNVAELGVCSMFVSVGTKRGINMMEIGLGERALRNDSQSEDPRTGRLKTDHNRNKST